MNQRIITESVLNFSLKPWQENTSVHVTDWHTHTVTEGSKLQLEEGFTIKLSSFLWHKGHMQQLFMDQNFPEITLQLNLTHWNCV